MRTVLTRILSSALIASVAATAWADNNLPKIVFEGPNPYRIENAGLKNAPVRVGRRGSIGFASRDMSLLSQRAAMAKVPFRAAASMPEILGSVIASDAWTTTANVGLYKVPTAKDQTFTEVIKGLDASYGGVLVEDTYWAVGTKATEGRNVFWITGYDINSGEEVASYAAEAYPQIAIGGMTYDATTGTVYALSPADEDAFDSDALSLVTLSFGPTSTTYNVIASVADQYACIAAAADGTLYGVVENDAKTSTLVKIDKTTGVATPAVTDSKTGKAVTTGIKPWDAASAIIDPTTGRMFWTVYDAWYKGYIAEIDLKKGTATKLYDFPGNEWVMGLAIKKELDPGVPGIGTDLALTYDKGSLSGKLTFMAPAKTLDDKAGTGALTYVVECNGQVISTGPTVYGAKVIVDYNVPAADNYTFIVYFTNAKGQGPKATISKYIGQGIPSDTEYVTLTYVGGRMTVEWAAVKTSADAGYLDPSKVTYTVTPYYNGVKDASKAVTTSELMWAERITEPQGTYETYAYGVSATYNNITSREVMSNTVALGYYNIPYTNTLATAADFDKMTVINSNEDKNAWSYDSASKAAKIMYNTSKDMDDWMITPPVRLEKGKTYKLSFKTFCGLASYPERIEVKVGTAATAEAMTSTVVAPAVVAAARASNAIELSGYYEAEATGDYYFGFHGISDANSYYLCVNNIEIVEGEANIPAAVKNLVVTPAVNGDLKVSVSFTAPSTDFGGTALTDATKITEVKISRNGTDLDQAVDFVDGVATYTFTDNVPAVGEYTYTVSCKNVNGWGVEESKTVYVGINYPEPVAEVFIEELSTPGEISIHWPAVTQTITGQPLEASDVTYTVTYWDYDGGTSTQTTSETAITVKMCEPDGQAFALAQVVANTQRGSSDAVQAGPTPVGVPYTDYLNTFSLEDMNKYAYYTNSTFVSWYIGINGGPAGVDGDSNYLTCKASLAGAYGNYVTGVISLKDMKAPKLSFYTYNLGEENTNTISVWVKTPDQDQFSVLMAETTIQAIGEQDMWSQVLLDLSKYAGKDIQIRLQITNKAYVYTLVDNLQVFSPLANDLEAKIIAPQFVNAGMDYNVQVEVTSNGYETAKDYTVELYADGKLAETKAGDALTYEKSTVVDFERTFDINATTPVLYKAVVNFKADEDLLNNTTEEVSVTPIVDGSPVVTTLDANSTPAGVELTWTEPDTKNAAPWQITEDFEDAAEYATVYGDWTFQSLDDSRNYTLEETAFPTAPNAYLVGDANTLYVPGKSGDKYLVALPAVKGPNDDWAISPELSGKRQIVSFYVRSYSVGHPSFEFYYSTNDNKPESFKLVEAISNVSTAWSQYAYIIPEGAKYFAIRCTSNNVCVFLLDDVSFTPKAMKAAYLAIKGYNVYRDGVKINDALVTETKYLDATAVDKTRYKYTVNVVYEKSVSGASNAVTIMFNDIDEIAADNLAINTEDGAIVVTGAEGMMVTVVAVDGKTLYAAEGNARVSVLPGVYVVKAGEKVAKVLVK
ncbi:MAG: choice-of-anchor J domain-containing protein [Muribaculaceae bacterium]|nr:choice-of-anchor J domain-containing protein [Muribaculaceae bacterium]